MNPGSQSNDLITKIQNSLETLPQPIQQHFKTQPLENWSTISSQKAQELCQALQTTPEQLALTLLPFAAAYAHVPISNYFVGAIAIDSAGVFYFGANIEFTQAAIAHTVHAEQSAISHAWLKNATPLQWLVINYSPCGHCRQFIKESARSADFRIQLPNRAPQSLDYYLPESFGPVDLGIEQRLLRPRAIPKNWSQSLQPIAHPLFDAAAQALFKSHSPYSNSECSIALAYEDGGIVVGCYGENAAFNPSIAPLQVALNYRRMQGKIWQQGITQALMLERQSVLSQRHSTETLLKLYTDIPLDYHAIELP
ncbi:cytidine deaminase [Rappaport israeli]|uniref:cytidine deaminase n=1 Tax=Rappaport israeli TaxID=1839807 RepID=UPI00092FE82E|nr:cytidine deaminase [Rappaport israeli]